MIAEVRSSEAGYKTSVPSHSCDPAKLLNASFDDWTAGSMAPDPAAILAGAGQIRGFAGDPLTMIEQREIDGYQSRQLERGVAYYKVGDTYSRPALFDTGRRIYINDDDRASIVTALRLMSERSGGRPVKPFGPPEFLAQVQRIADAEGIAVEIASPRQPITAKAQPFPMSASGDKEASALQIKATVCEVATAMVAPTPVVAPDAPVVPREVPIIPPVPPVIPEVAPLISPARSAVAAVAPDVPAIPRVLSSVAPVVFAEASIEPLAILQDTEIVNSSPTVSKIDRERPLGSALSEPSPVEVLISMFCEAKTDEERRKAAAKIRSTPTAFAEMNRIGGELWKSEQRRFAELQRAQQWGQQGRGY
jgi:hypothetical protein